MKGKAIVLLLALAILSSGCVQEQPQGEETVKVGAILPLSGSSAYYGNAAKNGMEIARAEIAWQYPELDIEIIYEDSFYTPKGGIDAYSKLGNIDNVDAVITGASQVSLAVQPLAQEDGILQMAIFSSAGKYTSPNDLAFRTSNRNELEASRTAEFIKNKGFERLAIIYLNNDFGVGFKDALLNELERQSVPVEVAGVEAALLDEKDFRTILSKLAQENPDVVFMVGIASQYGLIMKQAEEMGLNVQFLSMRSAEDPMLFENAGETAEGLIYTYPFDSGSRQPQIEKFSTAFKEAYNAVPDAYAAEGYEGFRLTALAFNECGKDYGCIKNYLEGLDNFKSVFGNLGFDENGDVRYEFFLKTVKNGEFVLYEGE